jgi:choline dehydrogenase-like flavoprotein
LIDVDQVNQIERVVAEADDISFGSSHPQGGNPMSDDPNRGVVDSDFRVHGFDNLFVCDASVFPDTIQANPQLTVMAIADYAASRIAQM